MEIRQEEVVAMVIKIIPPIAHTDIPVEIYNSMFLSQFLNISIHVFSSNQLQMQHLVNTNFVLLVHVLINQMTH